MIGVGTLDAREQIVQKHIPLVKYIASRVIIGKTRYVEYDDLVGYGMLGLMDAINKFDESKGMQFSTYSSIRIKGAMIDELRKNSPLSKGAIDKLNKYNEAVEQLQTKLLRDPTNDEVAIAHDIGNRDGSEARVAAAMHHELVGLQLIDGFETLLPVAHMPERQIVGQKLLDQ